MKFSAILLLFLILASGAWAVLDPDPDQMGIYFDTEGDLFCIDASFASMVPIYILYTHPTLSAVRGFECGMNISTEGIPGSVVLNTIYPVNALNMGSRSGNDFNYIVGYASPVPTTIATVLATLEFFYMDPTQLDLTLGPANPASLGSELPVILCEDFSLLPVGTSTRFTPSAQINGELCRVIATDEATWDSIKAMYR